MLNLHPSTDEPPDQTNTEDDKWRPEHLQPLQYESSNEEQLSSVTEDTSSIPTPSRPTIEDVYSEAETEEMSSPHEQALASLSYSGSLCEVDDDTTSESDEDNVLAEIQNRLATQLPPVNVDNSSNVHVGPRIEYNTYNYFTAPDAAVENGISLATKVEENEKGPENTGGNAKSEDPLMPVKEHFLKKHIFKLVSFAAVIVISIIVAVVVSHNNSSYDDVPEMKNIAAKNKDLTVFDGAKSVQWVVDIVNASEKTKVMWYSPGCKKIEEKDGPSKYDINYVRHLEKGKLQTVLTVHNVTPHDRGLYRIQVRYDHSKAEWEYFTLNVQGSVPLQKEYVVVCYVAAWAHLRTGLGKFTVDDIDPTQCTHLIYAFANLSMTTNSITSKDPGYDLEENDGEGAYKKMTSLKLKFPHLKVLIGMGGWAERMEKNYSAVAEDPERRKQLVDSISQFLRLHNFDGLDFHWQYPAEQWGRPGDKQNFVYLLKELREEFDKQGKGWLLTAPLGVLPDTIERSYDVPEISKYLHYMIALCYAYHGFWDGQTGPNAPLYPTKPGDKLNVESSIKTLLKLGAPSRKLVLALPLYGRNFRLKDKTKNIGFGAATTGFGLQGTYVQEDGTWGYNEICYELKRDHSNWVKHWDSVTHTPYVTRDETFMSYDNQESLTDKVNLAINKNLGGVAVYSLDTDDFRGYCAFETSGATNYPLMRTVNHALYNSSFGPKQPCIDS